MSKREATTIGKETMENCFAARLILVWVQPGRLEELAWRLGRIGDPDHQEEIQYKRYLWVLLKARRQILAIQKLKIETEQPSNENPQIMQYSKNRLDEY